MGSLGDSEQTALAGLITLMKLSVVLPMLASFVNLTQATVT